VREKKYVKSVYCNIPRKAKNPEAIDVTGRRIILKVT
jgi:hypothetical protein